MVTPPSLFKRCAGRSVLRLEYAQKFLSSPGERGSWMWGTLMAKTRIAIACQGGGSQTAFTAGALKGLLKERERLAKDFRVVSISGTSGGSLCAALVWYSFMRGDNPLWQRLIDFWHDNTARDGVERMFNDFIVTSLRSVHSGWLPTLHMSPSSPALMTMMSAVSAMMPRREFMDFPALLGKYIDFDEIRAWGPLAEPPVLMVGAANTTTGHLTKFVSTQEPIRLEHLLASCCVPSIFPAVMINGDAYWDGLFSDNPPIRELIRPFTVGFDNIPEEIWVIKINPTTRKRVPVEPADINDRHNQLQGNISLFQQLEQVQMVNDQIIVDAFRPEFLAQMDVTAPVRIPKPFSTSPDRPYHIPWIEMPEAVQETLDYEGKIDRSAENIDRLIAAGEASARKFLAQRAVAVAAGSGEVGKAMAAALKESVWQRVAQSATGSTPLRTTTTAKRRPSRSTRGQLVSGRDDGRRG